MLRQYLQDFMKLSGYENVSHNAHAIGNVEAFYWWALVAHYRPDVIVETGVANGRSTVFLSRAAEAYGAWIHCAVDIDASTFPAVRARIGESPRTLLLKEDACKFFAERRFTGERVLAILDGPKNGAALRLLLDALSEINLVGLGMHDCSPSHDSKQYLLNAHASHWPDAKLVFTDDKMNSGLWPLNNPILPQLVAASRKSRRKWSAKTGVDVTPEVYESWLGQVGLMFVE